LTDRNRVGGPPAVIYCASDRKAIEQAKKRLDGHDVEVSQADRLVIRLRSDSK
jgi:hypothetical protein